MHSVVIDGTHCLCSLHFYKYNGYTKTCALVLSATVFMYICMCGFKGQCMITRIMKQNFSICSVINVTNQLSPVLIADLFIK